tara:strand:+ start:3760 stop:4782 length:1023 start_codon:yes stop_codon:yes gene_type:complete
MSKNSILITGGAGYVGSVLTKKLVEQNFDVTVLDSLIFGNDGISELITKDSIKLLNFDLRDTSKLQNSLDDIDYVIHLAAIVGEPLCKKIPIAARQINEFATKNLINTCKSHNIKKFFFASTCSNYGSSTEIVNEESPLQPLSLYSECKVNSEKFLLNKNSEKFETCILRFATAHGLSPRMRFDLLLQEFLRDALVDHKITIFGQDFWRPLVHVQDMTDACILAINGNTEQIAGQVYNVGDSAENYTKISLAKTIQKFLPSTEIEIIQSKNDPRNYKVSFEKIKNNLNFSAKKTVEDSLKEILAKVNSGNLDPKDSEFSNISKLTENVKTFENYNFDESL